MNIFNVPLPDRCLALANLFSTTPNKELENLYPSIIDNIFGASGKTNWGLRLIQNENRAFHEIYSFLHPMGPLFNLCYRLLSNCYLEFEFPYEYCSELIQRQMSNGTENLFYTLKKPINKTKSNSLILNAFEYYIMHFAYHLVNPALCIPTMNNSLANNNLYIHLVNTYLSHFLPCTSSIVQPPLTHVNVPSTKLALPDLLPRQLLKKPSFSIFREDVIARMNEHNPVSNFQSNCSSTTEIWRSELISRAFIDYWLITENTNLKNQLVPSLFYAQTRSACNQHLHCVRMLFKHLHYFSSYILNENCMMNNFKRVVVSRHHATIYQFFNYSVAHYPLDTSFVLLLETWLSYIQPWRYTDLKNIHEYGVDYERNRSLNSTNQNWFAFIAENLMTYTRIYYLILIRMANGDLTLFKHAYMLFRLTKVMSQPNLVELIIEVESHLNERNNIAGGGICNNNWSPIIRRNIECMESRNYQYEFFNSDSNIEQVNKVLLQIKDIVAVTQQKIWEMKNKEDSMSVLDWFKEQLSSSDDSIVSPDELKNLISQLKCSFENLCLIHRINASISVMEDNYSSSFSLNDVMDSSMRSVLQNTSLIGKNCISSEYTGDPDTRPRRSWEISFLIPLLNQISNYVNTKYSDEIEELYYDNGLYGSIARQILNAPQRIFIYEKRHPPFGYTRRISKILPPRISFRWLCSKYVFFQFLVMYLLLSLFGFSKPIPILFFVTFYIVYIFIRGFFNPFPIVYIEDDTKN